MNRISEGNFPLAYLITLRSYGTWLHGDEKGSIDRHGFNIYNTPRMFHSEKLNDLMKRAMKQSPMFLAEKERSCVLNAIKEVCNFRGYEMYAVNIRTNHLHAVVSANANPNKIVNDFKAYATRRLRNDKLIGENRIVWARGKSRQYFWKTVHVETAIDYVLFGQDNNIPSFE